MKRLAALLALAVQCTPPTAPAQPECSAVVCNGDGCCVTCCVLASLSCPEGNDWDMCTSRCRKAESEVWNFDWPILDARATLADVQQRYLCDR